MSSNKKTIFILLIIVLILVIIITVAFTLLYLNLKQPIQLELGETTISDDLKTEDKTASKAVDDAKKEMALKEKVQKIIKKGENRYNGFTQDAQDELEDVINSAIQEKLENRTPEQIAEDEKKQEEMRKLEEEVNRNIIKQLR